MKPEATTNGFRRRLLRGLWSILRPALLPFAVAAVLLAGVFGLARMTRESMRDSDRYTVPFAAIECAAPAGQDRARFLAEVRYVAEEPETLRLLDDDLAGRLARAFARHPWVERVEAVEVTPPKQVRARLVYRTPVLAVRLSTMAQGEPSYVVDARAVRLPAEALSEDLPLLAGSFSSPGVAGTRWYSATVESAARVAGLIAAHQQELHVARLQEAGGGLVLRTRQGAIIRWGQSGPAANPEPSDEEKLARLLAAAHEQKLSPGVELDLRKPEPTR